MKTKEKVKITFRGWPGHFICSDSCIFRLNTLLEYREVKIVVSTVGMMKSHWPKGSEFYKGAYEPVGCGRYYETMAFHAVEEDESGFIDADVSRQISFDSPWMQDKVEKELEANDMHYKVIEEIEGRLLKGDKFEG